MRSLLLSVLIFFTCNIFGGNDNSFLTNPGFNHPKRHYNNYRQQDYWDFDLGYANFEFKGKQFSGGALNFGLEANGEHFFIGFHLGTDFVINPTPSHTDTLPAASALRNYVFIDLSVTPGVLLGDRMKLEFPIKINIPLGGKHSTFTIPAFVNGHDFQVVAPGASLIFRLNRKENYRNAYLGLGANYRFAFIKNTFPSIGHNSDYSGLSYFVFLRFDMENDD